ncbi:hypothetical protein OF83DRAFT_1087139 [Amylostereum chailletii]|nr:hypothetical protein OF83DRAFT_1087139 [Amylostereum chailletii]
MQPTDLSPEIYSLIVKSLGNRSDLCNMCRVSKPFQAAAERALYNTLQMTEPAGTVALCELLAEQKRLAPLVVALTVSFSDRSEASATDTDHSESSPVPEYWDAIARALRRTVHLRFLNIHIDNGGPADQAWILSGCQFQLKTFHCDLSWDGALISFLSTQSALSDLNIADFREDIPENATISALPPTVPRSLPTLSILECTFTEAVALLVPGRPVTHIKSCFSRTEPAAKRAELDLLVFNLCLSTRPFLSVNIADSSYTERFSQQFLSRLVNAFVPDPQLRYSGPFALPVDGRERLRFYALLRQLVYLQCTELDVSTWDPPPVSVPAMRALASELHIYCPSVTAIIFLHDLEPTIVRIVNGIWRVDHDVVPDTLWRDV